MRLIRKTFPSEILLRHYSFSPGQMVIVKQFDEIAQELDSGKKRDGCLFSKQMIQFCGGTYKIMNNVKMVFNERLQLLFKVRGPLYILEGVFCDGKGDEYETPCDHSCPLLWHERWLQAG